jgi:O-antigen/teichoic acid export membrane protein
MRYKTLVNNELYKHISTAFIWDSFAKLIEAVTAILLIRIFSKNDCALYAFFCAAGALFTGVISGGIHMTYIRISAEEYSRGKTMPKDILAFSFAGCLLIFILLAPAILYYRNELSTLIFRNCMYSTPLLLGFFFSLSPMLTTFVSRFYQVQDQYKTAGLIFAFNKLSFLAFLIILLLFIHSLNFIYVSVIQITLSLAFGSLLFLFSFRDHIGWAKVKLTVLRFKKVFSVSFWLIN